MARLVLSVFALLLAAPVAWPAPRGLDIYFVDTEGGAATLLVTPAGESVLVDCGSPGDRDAGRIARAARDAGVTAIDHLIVTHYHSDHVGGATDLSAHMPIRQLYDKGAPVLDADLMPSADLVRAYQRLAQGKARRLKPGDALAFRGPRGARTLELDVVCAEGTVVAPRPGQSAPNTLAGTVPPRPTDTSDNARSLGFVVRFGDFRFLCLGDLTWNVEYALVHPRDLLGEVDLYQVTHHGLNQSSNPALLRTVRPRVAVFANGPYKGCDREVVDALAALAEPPAVYQVHRNLDRGAANAPAERVANAEARCTGEYIKVSVAPDGRTFTVQVGAAGAPATYRTRTLSPAPRR